MKFLEKSHIKASYKQVAFHNWNIVKRTGLQLNFKNYTIVKWKKDEQLENSYLNSAILFKNGNKRKGSPWNIDREPFLVVKKV